MFAAGRASSRGRRKATQRADARRNRHTQRLHRRQPSPASYRQFRVVRKKDFLVFVQVDAETFGHAVEGSAVDAEDLSGLATMMLGDVENVKKVAAF